MRLFTVLSTSIDSHSASDSSPDASTNSAAGPYALSCPHNEQQRPSQLEGTSAMEVALERSRVNLERSIPFTF